MNEYEGRRPEESFYNKSFGGKLKFYRERVALTPEELSKSTGIDTPLIYNWEGNEAMTIKKGELLALRVVLDLSALELQDLIIPSHLEDFSPPPIYSVR